MYIYIYIYTYIHVHNANIRKQLRKQQVVILLNDNIDHTPTYEYTFF